MTAITFDTLSTARRLREKGLSQEQAEAIADEIRMGLSVDISHLATKADLRELETALKSDLREMDMSVKGEISSIRSEMRELELRITVRLGGMIMALGGVLIAVKFLG